MKTKRAALSVVGLAIAALCANAAPKAPKVKIDLPHHPKDGMADVQRASNFGEAGKWDAGRKFVAELRAPPADKLNLEVYGRVPPGPRLVP